MKTTGGRLVVRALEDEDVPFTFGIPGTHNIELYDALAESTSVRPILVTDEQGASFMADGVWRASGRLGCVNVVPGAGLTHAMSGIAEAFMDNVPMLVLTCGIRTDTGRAYQLHDVDQLAMVAPVTKAQLRVGRGEELYATVRRACALARAGAPGPVVVEVPANLYLFRHEDSGAETGAGAGTRAGAGVAELIERAVTVLRAARRPLLYVGLGAAGARTRLVELAERLEVPVASTIQGKGVFPESHPLFLWPGFGDAAPAFVRKVVAGCDATLAIGCRFGEVATGSYGLVPPGRLMHVDIDPAVPGRNFPAEVGIEADAALFVDALLARLDEAPRPRDADLRERVARGHAAVVDEWREEAAASESVAPWALLSALQRRFGPDTIYATDSGNGTFLAMEQLRLDQPGRFLAPVDYSCMGYSVPAAIGAKLARPEAPVVALAGDGAFLMTGLELATAVAHEVPIAVFLLRDRELAQIAQFQDTALSRKTASTVSSYDLASLAGSLGVECVRVDRNHEIEAALDAALIAFAEGRPIAVDVAIDYSRKSYFTKGVVKTNLLRLPVGDRARFIARALGRRLLPSWGTRT
ncbi:MAG TPA: thiamine pyrophosphate-binding protein [Longimicrobiales bacterium]|nr:thiamine pyrophosphate-binding protein [Longimicrobiales bacterium]